ncbi:MAG: hypoxanthine-guanine phosphoribosyltransferase [Gammaproteobacteria bacterium]|nr:hypoxanthine-guanine phosphoribosyltransferase [Gammaproteobacteria bacterium]
MDLERVLAESEVVCTEDEVATAFDRMASEIRAVLKDSNPVVLCVMLGGLIPTARLLVRFDFPLELDYVHATRYRGDTTGKDLHWRAKPATALKGREVLVIDDILDEGITLSGVLDFCRAEGAKTVLSAVLVEKQHERKKTLRQADFTGLKVDDRYVFGCGMDYHDCFRNLRSIHAVRES